MFRRVSVASLALALALVTGCSGSPGPVETTPGFATEEEAFAAAEATYRAYVDALNQVDLSDPATFEPVFALTTGELNASDRTNFSKWHAEGLRLEGAASVSNVEFIELSQPSANRSVTLEACYDITQVDVLDADGISVVEAERPDVQSLRVTVVSNNSDARMRVSAIQPARLVSCE